VVHKCLGTSTRVLRTITDGDVSGSALVPDAVLLYQLVKALGFSRVT
jgi:hypothetical protein